MLSEADLIQRVIERNRKAQNEFYNRFAATMYGVCLRYARNADDAQDILQEGFVKVFRYLKNYRGEGSLEGWVRRTMINTAINHYKKMIKHQGHLEIETVYNQPSIDEKAISNLSHAELSTLISELPDGYRMVFNLNVVEGYTHKEIGEIMNISENTSKSQLSRARAALQKKLEQIRNIEDFEQE